MISFGLAYLLRSGGEAAQLRCVDGEIRIDASDTRQRGFEAIVTDARSSLMAAAAAVQIRPSAVSVLR
jgi:hypothetical protein